MMAADTLTAEGKRFMTDWQQLYPGTPPIGHHFKSSLAKRWMRIHSLPGAKRYAADKAESDILLSRQNALIDYLVPQGQPVQILFTRLESDSHIFRSFDLIRLGMFQHVGDEADYEIWMMNDEWHSGHLERDDITLHHILSF
jgi:hypothetical protein